MIKILLPIAALLSGIALLLLGTGLLNTLLALRGSGEGFSDQTLGLLGSAYFAGFILGTWLCPKLIRRMGHVRAFAFLAAAPVACSAALLSGLAMGGFWGLGAVYAGRMGMDTAQIATFVSLVIIAGAASQWPLGMLSDRTDRRMALAIISAIAVVGGLLMVLLGQLGQWLLLAAAVFGAGSFAVYLAAVALLIDHLHHEDILSGNASLLMLHGLGAAIGPALAGWLMGVTAPLALPLFFAVMFGVCALYALQQARRGADHIVDEPAHYIPMVRTSTEVLGMMLEDAEVHGAETQTDKRSTANDSGH